MYQSKRLVQRPVFVFRIVKTGIFNNSHTRKLPQFLSYTGYISSAGPPYLLFQTKEFALYRNKM